MRLAPPLALSVAAAIAVAAPATAAAPQAKAGPPATIVTVVRPVDTTGHARPGFTEVGDVADNIDCSFADPSAGAVDRNIEECSPSAAYVPACWRSAVPHQALCTRDPSKKRLVRVPYTGAFAPTAPPKKAQRAPLIIVLGDGTRCSIRIGGAGASYPGRPDLYASYYCDKHGSVWTKDSAAHRGVNESAASWTVHTAPSDGNGPLVVRHVKRAFFVGTFTG